MFRIRVIAICASFWAAAGATETTPEAAAFFNEGVAHANAGQYDQALASFEKAVAADPNLIEAHEWVGHILILQGKYEDAVKRYQLIVARRPSTETKVNLGLAYLRIGQIDQAIKTLENAVAVDSGNAAGWNNLSLAYLRAGRVAEARGAAEKALALKPGYAPAYVNLGNAQLRAGEAENAIASFGRALGADPNLADAYFGLAEAYAFLGDNKKAGDYYVKYLIANPTDESRRGEAVQWLWDHGRGAEVP